MHASSSIIIVNFNGRDFLRRCLNSLKRQSYRGGQIEILVVDNGSSDGSVELLHGEYPDVLVLLNSENNYCKALNIGISRSSGEFIAFLNNDMVVEEHWLAGLIELLKSDERIGCGGGKIHLMDGKINSVGIEPIGDFYFRDKGFGERDEGQYGRVEPTDGITGGAVLWRRKCLEDVGCVDEDYMMYFEDVDLAFRCKAKGWLMLYTPYSVAHHRLHGSSAGTDLCYYFCNRNRLLFLARHFPHELPRGLFTSHFYRNGQLGWLYESIPIAVKKLYEHHPQRALTSIFPEMRAIMTEIFGEEKTAELFRWLEVVLGLRQPRIAVYDHALHLPGRGQQYGCTAGQILQHRYDITYIAHKPVTLQALESWYDLDLSRCQLKIIPRSFTFPAASNAFEPIKREGCKYDIFINATGVGGVRPKSCLSVFFCHFPDAAYPRDAAAAAYHSIIASSRHAADRLKERWGLIASAILYPPVNFKGPAIPKEDLILAVIGSDVSRSKTPKAMMRAFMDLWKRHRQLMQRWRFIMAGESLRQKPHRERIMMLAYKIIALVLSRAAPIEIRVDVSPDELKDLYARAKIFWNATGLNGCEPYLIEPFGTTTIEAMQNGCVPVVINGSGQREVVEHGVSGYRFDSISELQGYTLQLIAQPALLQQLSERAYNRGEEFHASRFWREITRIFDAALEEYKTIKRPRVSEFLKNATAEDDASPVLPPIDV